MHESAKLNICYVMKEAIWRVRGYFVQNLVKLLLSFSVQNIFSART